MVRNASRSASPLDVRGGGSWAQHSQQHQQGAPLPPPTPRRNRSRVNSVDVDVDVPHDHSYTDETPPPRRRTASQRSSSGIGLALSLAAARSRAHHGDDDTSDTGAEGDEDNDEDVALHRRPVRARSSPHLPLEFLNTERLESGGMLTPSLQTSTRTPSVHPEHLADQRSPHHLTPEQIWQLRHAAFSLSPRGLAGLGLSASSTASAEHSEHTRIHAHDEDDHAHLSATEDFLPPPPPYEASEEGHHHAATAAAAAATLAAAHQSINLIELEQAHASLGRRLHGERERDREHDQNDEGDGNGDATDALAFRTRPSTRNRQHPRRTVSENTAGVAAPTSASASTTTAATTPPTAAAAAAALPPPAWQPKSDTEAEDDTTARDEVRETIGELRSMSGRPRSRARRSGRPNGRVSGGISQNAAVDAAAAAAAVVEEEDGDSGPPLWLLRWLLHPLRLLAAVPGCVGTFWLLRNAWTHYVLSEGSFTRRGPLDPLAPHVSNPFRLTCGVDFLLASLWACSTAYHALSLTTLMLRRWLVYYSLFPSLIRLIALQAICWPLVRLTIWVAGPDRPVEAWIVIASFTAFSDVVARWVTSNIADKAVVPRRAAPAVQPTSSSSSSRGKLQAGQRFWRAVMGAPFDSSTSESEGEGNDGDETDALSGSALSTSALDGIGRSGMTHILTRRIRNLRAATRAARRANDDAAGGREQTLSPLLDVTSGIETDEYDGETSDARGGRGADYDDDEYDDDDDEDPRRNGENSAAARARLALLLRRKKRRHRMRLKMAAVSGLSERGGSSAATSSSSLGFLSLFSKKATDDTMLLTSGELKVRIRSRRIFHWQVAMKRNVAPIGVLAYVTLWAMLLTSGGGQGGNGMAAAAREGPLHTYP